MKPDLPILVADSSAAEPARETDRQAKQVAQEILRGLLED
jgi:hypothetical protein